MQKRSLIKVFLLYVITLGLYYIYWLVMTRRDMLRLKAPVVPPSVIVPIVPMIFGFIAALSGYLIYAFGRSDVPIALIVFLGTFAGASFLAAFAIGINWIWRYSAAAESVTHKYVSQNVSFWLWVLAALANVTFLWLLFMQHEFNSSADKTKAPKKSAKPAVETI